jgi:hypothetical protein
MFTSVLAEEITVEPDSTDTDAHDTGSEARANCITTFYSPVKLGQTQPRSRLDYRVKMTKRSASQQQFVRNVPYNEQLCRQYGVKVEITGPD